MAPLAMDELKELIAGDQVDTILAVFPDHYGRLAGKRLASSYFLENSHFYCCDYLLSTSMEMDPQPGFEMSSWEQGYGDLVFIPDLDTLRRIPWLPKTVLVMCDLVTEAGEPVTQSPRTILREQCDRLAERGIKAYVGSELEFHLFRGSFSDLRKAHYQNLEPSSPYRIDYHILATSFDEPLIRAIRNGMIGAGVPIECSKGECSNGQYEIGLYYAEALEMADRHLVYKNGAKEIAYLHDAALTFMAKYDEAEGGSGCHIHSSLFDTHSETNLFWDAGADQPSELYRHFLGGLLALCREFFLLYAPTVNSYKRFCAESFAPTRIAWGHENRTTGFRIVGHKQSFRVENRLPGADANPYLAFAATIAAGLYGIDHRIEPPDEYVGNAYTATQLPQVPDSLTQAADLFERSATARALFGDPVVDHYVQSARLEQESYDRAVTDWELNRYFERI